MSEILRMRCPHCGKKMTEKEVVAVAVRAVKKELESKEKENIRLRKIWEPLNE